jgi:hypothetical protein
MPAIKTHTIQNGLNYFLEFTLGSIRITYQLQLISISDRHNQNSSLITKLTQSYSNLRVKAGELFVSTTMITEKAITAFRSIATAGVDVFCSTFYKRNNVSFS